MRSFRKCKILAPDSGQRKPGLFHKRSNDMRTLELVLLLKALWNLCVLSLQQPHESQLPTLPRLRFESRSDRTTAVHALALAWRSRRSAVPSQRSLFIVARCSRAPCRPSAESLTLSMARIHLLVEGAAASLLALFAGRSLGSTARNTGKSSNT